MLYSIPRKIHCPPYDASFFSCITLKLAIRYPSTTVTIGKEVLGLPLFGRTEYGHELSLRHQTILNASLLDPAKHLLR